MSGRIRVIAAKHTLDRPPSGIIAKLHGVVLNCGVALDPVARIPLCRHAPVSTFFPKQVHSVSHCPTKGKAAAELYTRGVSAGKSFEEINDEISKECGTGLLRPVNSPYFTVRRQDFAIPEVADINRTGGRHIRYNYIIVTGPKRSTRLLNPRPSILNPDPCPF